MFQLVWLFRKLYRLKLPTRIIATILLFTLILADLHSDGPYCWAYNRSYQRKFEAAGLKGQGEVKVIEALGEPTYEYGLGENTTCFNYCPYTELFPWNKFQVSFKDGVCTGYELLDD